MTIKAVLVLCAQLLFVQVAYSQCLGRAAPALAAPGLLSYGASSLALPALAAPGYGYGIAGPVIEAVPTSGGGLPITSLSPIAPNGIVVSSDNAIEGNLLLAGELPFLSAVALEGILPTAGAGAVSYSCGNGITAITSEGLGLGASYGPALGAIAPAAAFAPGISAISPAAGLRGCGCGGLGAGLLY